MKKKYKKAIKKGGVSVSIQKVNYWVEKRKNIHVKHGYQWMLCVKTEGRSSSWALWTWNKKDKPDEEEVEKVILCLNQAMDFAIKIIARWEPPFLQTQRVTKWDREDLEE